MIRELITVNIDEDEHDDIIAPEDLFYLILFEAEIRGVSNEVIMFHYDLRETIEHISNILKTRFIIIDRFGNYKYITSPPFTDRIIYAISGEIGTCGMEAFQNLGKPIDSTCMTSIIMEPFKDKYNFLKQQNNNNAKLSLGELNELSKEILVSFIMDGYTILYLTDECVHCCTDKQYNNKKKLIESQRVTDLYNLKKVFEEVMFIYKSNPQKIINKIQNRKKEHDELLASILENE